jgi:hypothetical protein
MKSLTQHITEKLVLNNNTKVKGANSFLDRIEWSKSILDSFSKRYNFDLLNVDFSKDKEVFNNLATIYGNNDNEKLMEYFLHLLMTFEYMEEDEDAPLEKLTEEILFDTIKDKYNLAEFEENYKMNNSKR